MATPLQGSTGVDSQSYYDFLAADFSEQDEFWNNPYDNEIWRLEHELIQPYLDESSPLLDLGCGFYPHSELARNRFVIAIDVSGRSLGIARDYGDRSCRVMLVQADAEVLPFAPCTFGQAIAGGELFNHLDYRRCLDEVSRTMKPGGVLLLQFGAKWCLDSLWALLDSHTGGHLGYAVTKEEARTFFRGCGRDVSVTWEVTPKGDFTVQLLGVGNVRAAAAAAGFEIVDTYGANSLSGLIPLPFQQRGQLGLIGRLATVLIRCDRILGRLYPFRTFAGNVFFVCRKLG